jgi:hypothetical protein
MTLLYCRQRSAFGMPLSSLFRIRQARGREICAMRPACLDCLTTAFADDRRAADLRARFWGMRYAQVKDPDGNIVDLFADL